MRPTSIHGSRLQLFRWKFSLNDRDDDVELDKITVKIFKMVLKTHLLQSQISFLLFFPISPLTRRNSPFTIFPQYMDPIPFAARSAPLNYCRANVTFLPLSAKVLIHRRIFPNTNPISTDLEPLLELGQLSFIALGRRFVGENIFHALFPP